MAFLLATLPAAVCAPAPALSAPTAAPVLMKAVTAVRFASGELVRPGEVLVASGRGGRFVCALSVGRPPALRENHGWLPAASLAPASGAGEARWSGGWRTRFGQITIRQRGAALMITGAAEWGADDPERVARGGVHTGEIAARATPRGARLSFAEIGGCAGRMWVLGPYLVVADNGRCGGQNVTFTGVYRRAPLDSERPSR
jgi:hypothetical protein